MLHYGLEGKRRGMECTWMKGIPDFLFNHKGQITEIPKSGNFGDEQVAGKSSVTHDIREPWELVIM